MAVGATRERQTPAACRLATIVLPLYGSLAGPDGLVEPLYSFLTAP